MGEQNEQRGVEQSVRGRIAVVTGASGGIGSAVCAELTRLGCRVHAIALDDALLDELRNRSDLGDIAISPLDVRNAAALRLIIDEVKPDIP